MAFRGQIINIICQMQKLFSQKDTSRSHPGSLTHPLQGAPKSKLSCGCSKSTQWSVIQVSCERDALRICYQCRGCSLEVLLSRDSLPKVIWLTSSSIPHAFTNTTMMDQNVLIGWFTIHLRWKTGLSLERDHTNIDCNHMYYCTGT